MYTGSSTYSYTVSVQIPKSFCILFKLPNLFSNCRSAESFLLGSNEKLKVDIIVQNEGEDSFESTFDMTVPPGVNYVKIERVDDNENDIPVQCSAPSVMTNHTLHCDIGNPLPRDKYVS